jgi:hypothetical protein
MAPLMRSESAAIPAMPSPGSRSCRRETLGCVGTLPCRWCTHGPLHDAGADASGCELWRMIRELRTEQHCLTFTHTMTLRPVRFILQYAVLSISDYTQRTFCAPLFSNAPFQHTLLNLRYVTFGLTPFDWLLSITLNITYSIISCGNDIWFATFLIYAHLFRNTTREVKQGLGECSTQ